MTSQMKRKLKDNIRKITGTPKKSHTKNIESRGKAFGQLSVKRNEHIMKTKGVPKRTRRETEEKSRGKP